MLTTISLALLMIGSLAYSTHVCLKSERARRRTAVVPVRRS